MAQEIMPQGALQVKGKKEKVRDLYSAFSTLKVLRYGSHSFTCKLYHTCLYLVSVHQTAPPLIVVADI